LRCWQVPLQDKSIPAAAIPFKTMASIGFTLLRSS
jgi:hypothetical protein